MAMPDELKDEKDVVGSYRLYYHTDKATFAKWSHRDKPYWWDEGLAWYDKKGLPVVEYKYNEKQIMQDIKEHIDSTYTKHGSGSIQTTEFTIDAGHGEGFCIGNIIKYAQRYGKKNGYNKETY